MLLVSFIISSHWDSHVLFFLSLSWNFFLNHDNVEPLVIFIQYSEKCTLFFDVWSVNTFYTFILANLEVLKKRKYWKLHFSSPRWSIWKSSNLKVWEIFFLEHWGRRNWGYRRIIERYKDIMNKERKWERGEWIKEKCEDKKNRHVKAQNPLLFFWNGQNKNPNYRRNTSM